MTAILYKSDGDKCVKVLVEAQEVGSLLQSGYTVKPTENKPSRTKRTGKKKDEQN